MLPRRSMNMTANYTEACFQAHKRFRSSAIFFCFFHSLVLYFKCIYVERTHTHTHTQTEAKYLDWSWVSVGGWGLCLMQLQAAKVVCVRCDGWREGEWSGVGVPRGSVVGAAVRLQVLKTDRSSVLNATANSLHFQLKLHCHFWWII